MPVRFTFFLAAFVAVIDDISTAAALQDDQCSWGASEKGPDDTRAGAALLQHDKSLVIRRQVSAGHQFQVPEKSGLSDEPDQLEAHSKPISGVPLPVVRGQKSVMIPVPTYVHSKVRCIGTGEENPLLGDPLEARCLSPPGVEPSGEKSDADEIADLPESEEGVEIPHTESHGAVILMVFIVLLMGVANMFVLERYLPFVPYTAAMFMEGLLIAVVQAAKRHYGYVIWPSFDMAVKMWANAEPHLILFIFLPPLVFGEAMSLNVSLVKACAKQCLLLAGPGVLIGTALTGVAARYLLPYAWDWNTSMLFGAIVSATDPVAVVAIFNSLGVSPRLTMVISGESLFNDGTAYVLFQLFMVLCQGVYPSMTWVLGFFFQMAFAGPLVGALGGMLANWFIGLSSEQHYAGDPMGQVIITVCCAYLSFFIAESMESSGMLALVASGLVVANDAWPRFIDRGTLHTIWHAIEFVGNTVIFVLAGLIFGGVVCERRDLIQVRDFSCLGLLYVVSMLIRAIMVGILWVPLNRMGHAISWQEGVVMVWSGMRGAVGLLMAVVADQNIFISPEARTLIIFHAGGMAAVMLLINGPLTPLVLQLCGLMEKSDEETVLEEVQQRVAVRTKAQMRKDLAENADTRALFSHAEESQVRQMVFPPELATHGGSVSLGTLSPSLVSLESTALRSINPMQLQIVRESFLRVVKIAYWELLDHGVLPRKSYASKVLLDSADLGMMGEVAGVHSEWEAVRQRLQLGQFTTQEELNATAGFCSQPNFERHQRRGVTSALAFIYAHEQALAVIKSFRSADAGEVNLEEKVLIKAVEEQNKEAQAYVDSVPKEVLTLAQNTMLARKLLAFQAEQVNDLASRGLITDTHASELEHRLKSSARDLIYLPLDKVADFFATRQKDMAARVADPVEGVKGRMQQAAKYLKNRGER